MEKSPKPLGQEHESSTIEKIIEEEFSTGDKLEQGSVRNLVEGIYNWINAGEEKRKEWEWESPEKFLVHYEDDVRKRYAPKTADLIMEKSDPEAVASFNEIVDEMRASSNHILQEGVSMAEPYLERLRKLIR